MKIRPATDDHRRLISLTGVSLRAALQYSKRAGAPKLADKIRRALKSWDGARRHVRHRMNRTSQ